MMPGRELSLQVAARVLVAALIRAAVVSFGLWLAIGLGEGSRGPPGEPQLPPQPEVPWPSSISPVSSPAVGCVHALLESHTHW